MTTCCLKTINAWRDSMEPITHIDVEVELAQRTVRLSWNTEGATVSRTGWLTR